MDKLKTYIYVFAFVISAVIAVEARYAKSGYVKQVERRLDQKIDVDRMDNIQDRIWKLEDRYGVNCETCPEVVREEYRELQKEYEFLDKKLNTGD